MPNLSVNPLDASNICVSTLSNNTYFGDLVVDGIDLSGNITTRAVSTGPYPYSEIYTSNQLKVDLNGDPLNQPIDSYKKRQERMKEEKFKENYIPKKIIQNGPVTVVFWTDGTKTIVRKSENATDDPYNAFCAALAKKMYGNNTRVKKLIEKKTVAPKEKKGKKNDGDTANQEC